METLLTENGYYRILCAPGGALMENARDKLRQAAALGGELIYGDEIVIGKDGERRTLKKPGWSPDTLRSFNYIGSPVAVSSALWEAACCQGDRTPAERHRNLLRMTALAEPVLHVPEALYIGPAQPACDPVPVVADWLRRQRAHASVRKGLLPGTAAVRYYIPRGSRVSCIVYGSGGMEAFRRTLEDVACYNTYLHVELLVSCGCRPDENTERYLHVLKKRKAAGVLRFYGETNLARLCNRAAELAEGDALLFLPAGYLLRSHDGLTRMLEYALQPHAGTVCGLLRQPGEGGEDLSERIVRNVSLFGPPLMIRRDLFLSAGGFDETLGRVGYAEALCWRLLHRRLHNIATPYAVFQRPAYESGLPITARNEQRYKDLLFQLEREQEAGKITSVLL